MNKKLAQVRALLNLAEHPGTPENERLAASEKAAELMEKYAIDELMAREDHGTQDKIVMREYVRTGIYWQAEKENVCRLAEVLGMTSLYLQPDGWGKQQVRVRVWGFEADFVNFETLLSSMTLQLAEAWKLYRKGFTPIQEIAWREGTDMFRFKTRRSYMVGYGVGFCNRVRAGRNQAVSTSGTGAELVLVDRATRIRQQMEAENPDVKKARGMELNGAFNHGRAAGARARTGESALGQTKELS